jgi:uncharacterized alpha-E superfamily protein
MLSRVADSIFWMSRYLERAENVARFIEVNHNLALELGEEMADQWAPLVYTSGDTDLFQEQYSNLSRESVLKFLTSDRENPNSIVSCLQNARENARQVRENISSDMWEELNKFYLMVREATAGGAVPSQPHEFYQRIKFAGYLLVGITDATMSHGEGFHFARLGRLLERADKTSRIVDVKYFILLPEPQDIGTPLDVVQWSALLKSAGALEMYRKSHGKIDPVRVADFLMLDREFPRSMHFCLIKAEESLHALTGTEGGTFRNRAEQYLGRLRAELDYTHVNDVVRQGLHEFIDDFQAKLNAVGNAISETYFVSEPVESVMRQSQSQ